MGIMAHVRQGVILRNPRFMRGAILHDLSTTYWAYAIDFKIECMIIKTAVQKPEAMSV